MGRNDPFLLNFVINWVREGNHLGNKEERFLNMCAFILSVSDYLWAIFDIPDTVFLCGDKGVK